MVESANKVAGALSGAAPWFLCSAPDSSRSFFPAGDVGHFIEHITDAARIDDIGRRNFMLKLPGPVTQPDINSFFESELGFSWVVVLNDSFAHARVPFVEMETRKRLC
jgi:hypothetical protein